jgi:biotin carboxylase
MKKLNGLAEIYQFFRTNKKPIYFVSASPLNILGLGQFIPSLRYISYFDCFDGVHHRVFTPRERNNPEFTSLEDVVNYLLEHKETEQFMSKQARGGLMLAVMFDPQTQKLARKLGLKIALPPYNLRNKLDSKIITTQLGNEAGVASVPNILGTADNYAALSKLAKSAKLGDDLVVQTPYGDSGKTTFFVASESDWNDNAENMVGEELKVMKRINPRCGTVEAVATRHGTLVGPIMTELVGHKELTPYKGGWSGNEVFTSAVDADQRAKLVDMVQRFGNRLYSEGYKGTFCIDYLIDKNDGEMYLGELNPRISGASPITNLITQKYGGAPLLMFHLLEFMNVDYSIDIEAIQQRWADFDTWTHVIFKYNAEEVRIINQVPRSGIWRMAEDGNVEVIRRTADWSNVSGMDEAFFLRILGPGEYLYKGADMGVLLVRGHMQTASDKLTSRARNWVAAMKSQFHSTGLGTAVHPTLDDREMLYKIY